MEQSIKFNPDQILTQESHKSLISFANAGLDSIDYTMYNHKIMSAISTLDVDYTVEKLETLQNGFAGFSQVCIMDFTIISTPALFINVKVNQDTW